MLIFISKLQFRLMSSLFIQALFILFSFEITLFSLVVNILSIDICRYKNLNAAPLMANCVCVFFLLIGKIEIALLNERLSEN